MDLIYASRLPGSAGLQHGAGFTGHTSQRRLRTSKSTGSLLQPLARLLRDPTETIGTIIEGLRPESEEELDVELQKENSRKRLLLLRLQSAQSFEEWRASASELDRLEGNDAWKLEDECAEYDVKLVQARLEQLEQARANGDADRMLFLMRTSLTRDLGGMGDLRLYKHSRIGTKALIEGYIEEALDTLESLVNLSGHVGESGLDARHVMEQLLAARQAFGRSALLLSGGGTLGMNHFGVVKSLFEAQLLPRIISGSSAGSIVCAVLCTKTDSEIPAMLQDFCYGDLAVFEREGEEESVLAKAARFLKFGALFDISNLIRVMKDWLGDMTFQEAYNRTRRILNVCVSSASIYELPRLLNYITAPNVLIWSAVAASCSVPLIFSPASLLAKDPRTGEQVPWNPSPQRWVDGSVENDIPMTRLAEMFNVNHFIVSQVNPHVVPFLMKQEDDVATEAQRSTSTLAAGPGWMHTFANLAKGEALHRMHVLAELGIFPNALTKVRSVLGQRYSGDITIFPETHYTDFPNVLKNPSREFMVQAMTNGEKATWPKLSHIRNHCAIELALDDAVQQLRARVAFSPSQVDLRMSAFTRNPSLTRSERGGRIRRPSKGSHKTTRSETVRPRAVPGRESAHRQIRSLLDPPSAVPAVPSLKIPGPSPSDYFSSADSATSSPTPDSDRDIDDSENVLSDSTSESPPSPQPALWPSTRQRILSASQPATPSIASKSFLSSPLTPSSASSLTMTARQPSSPEMKYKKLFHNVKSNTMPTIRSQAGTPESGDQPQLPHKRSGINLQLDISGTRGMVRRRKRSLSTGLRGLFPPGKQ